MTDELSLSEDAFVFGDGVMKKKEMVTLEKKVYDVVLKNNARLMEENESLREALADCCCEYKNDGVPRCYARRDDPDGHCAAAKEGCLIYKILNERQKFIEELKEAETGKGEK